MSPPPNHGQIDTCPAALHLDGQNIDIGVRYVINRLLMQDARQSRHLIANFCCHFKLKLVGMRHHASFHGFQDGLCLALQEGFCLRHILRVLRH